MSMPNLEAKTYHPINTPESKRKLDEIRLEMRAKLQVAHEKFQKDQYNAYKSYLRRNITRDLL